jgi:hypothetical protein
MRLPPISSASSRYDSIGNCCCNRSIESQVCLPSRGITNIHSTDVVTLLHHDEAPSLPKWQFQILGQRHQCLGRVSLSASLRTGSCRHGGASSERLARKQLTRGRIAVASDGWQIVAPRRGLRTSFPNMDSFQRPAGIGTASRAIRMSRSLSATKP